jgi:hypothetical protein
MRRQTPNARAFLLIAASCAFCIGGEAHAENWTGIVTYTITGAASTGQSGPSRTTSVQRNFDFTGTVVLRGETSVIMPGYAVGRLAGEYSAHTAHSLRSFSITQNISPCTAGEPPYLRELFLGWTRSGHVGELSGAPAQAALTIYGGNRYELSWPMARVPTAWWLSAYSLHQDNCIERPDFEQATSQANDSVFDPPFFSITGNVDPGRPGTISGGLMRDTMVQDVPVRLTAQWEIYAAVPPLRARIHSPRVVPFGDSARFSSAASTGNITTRRWRLEPVGCPDLGSPKSVEGSTVQAVLLCDVAATLEVSDGTRTDTDSVTVRVTARDLDVDFRTATGQQPMPFTIGILHFGANVCSVGEEHASRFEGHGDIVHFTHRPSGQTRASWDDGSGYLAVQVVDGGPFDRLWYADEVRLRIHRRELVNSRLFPGGDIYEANAALGRKVFMDLLGRSIRAHESWHTKLMRTALLGTEQHRATARRVGALVARDRDELVTRATEEISALTTALTEATAENRVHEAMRRTRDFGQGGKVQAADGEVSIPSLADLGDVPP